MAENNKSYRIRTRVGSEADSFLDVKLDQDYDSLEILSLKISDKDTYRLHNSDYGVIVGRVLANGNFGVPNAKISVFIPADDQNSSLERWNLYPYTSTSTKNEDGIRYNLLPDESVKDCHKAVGTFPHKTYLLENESLLEVFDDYYIYTTRTNAAGDYLICGVPTGMQTLHMDLDLSDCGILSQRPRDFVYKGYTIEQFENPNQFKKDENIDGLSQIFSQNQSVYVHPFWGNEDNGEEIGITRADIDIAFKFEPTCVFMGSAVSDNASNGIGKKCVPTNKMGSMDELTAGEGTIEMIRKTPGGNVEEFSIKGNQVINGNGIWCYQIPMNLDYMMTDEYGNMVPTDDPEKGIPTRTRVRFRASLSDMEDNSQSYYRAKYLIPNNPRIDDAEVDYDFGTYTDEDSYRDLFWNGVYTVKSYIPRFQKSKRWRSERFSGIKSCNFYGTNNPMPYNNLRIKLPLVFTVLCVFVKLFMRIVTLINRMEAGIARIFIWFPGLTGGSRVGKKIREYGIHCVFIGDGLCPEMEGWYFAPGCAKGLENAPEARSALIDNTLKAAKGDGDSSTNATEFVDETSLDFQNTPESQEDSVCLTMNIDYLLNCFEMALAEEFRVINFDFYNDWVNGVLYFPRWMRKIKRKKRYRFSFKNGVSVYYKDKVQGCMNSENSTVKKTRYYTQQCSMAYGQNGYNSPYNIITSEPACDNKRKTNKRSKFGSRMQPAKCHKTQGMTQFGIFGKKSGLVSERTTMLGQYVYYLKPCEWKDTESGGKKRVLLFATDIVLLGTLNDCDENGIPQSFKYLNSSSYIMPTNLALTTLDDEAYIYTKGDGTVCSSTNVDKPSSYSASTVSRVSPDYKSTSVAYSKTDGDQIIYGENDDPIPVTETAGISWDYSGPGQDDENLGEIVPPDKFLSRLFGAGNKRLKYLYYPGGHFLGLSCINSETNIKSCVNLRRICELGASMSQRREEIRSYGDEGEPRYRYYVPTGLITNVDIESASFRSMFATINHNRLIADRTNEETGYKAYTFRFLRPDGFDGALTKYVHQLNSPYNKKVNDTNTPSAITDSRLFFMSGSGSRSRSYKNTGNWSEPDDYDSEETNYTERRTVEDSIKDYYMFRFGLDSFSDKEQKAHFLDSNTRGLLLPQYENSFYFYFGLKDGATAIDEFKRQFYSDCEANTVMKEPYLTVTEESDDNLSNPKAIVTINNMIGPYVVTVSDDTLKITATIMGYEKDEFNVENILRNTEPNYSITYGNQYTVTVTDTLEHTVDKTFVFGAGNVKMDFEAVNFRFKVPDARVTDLVPRKGGFMKINDEITILGENYLISDTGTPIVFGYRESTASSSIAITQFAESSSYKNESGELWHVYPFKKTGTYNIFIKFNGGDWAQIYTVTVEDNTDVELFTSCDYLGYKSGYGLSGLTEEQWKNSQEIFGPATLNGWLMRHSFYRQTQDDTVGHNHFLYASGKNGVAIFGQPENIVDLTETPGEDTLKDGTYSQRDYDQYDGYSLDDRNSFVPTMYWKNTERRMFDAMAYSEDGRAAADASDIEITSYSYSSEEGKITFTYNGTNPGVNVDHGCLIVLENGTMLFPVVMQNNRMVVYSDVDIYPTDPDADPSEWQTRINNLLSMATVYPTMPVPSFYKPFYGEVDTVVWNHERLDTTETSLKKVDLPISYLASGCVYNGLTYPVDGTGKFYSGETGNYATYFINDSSPLFWDKLTAQTDSDYMENREHWFSFSSDTTNSDYRYSMIATELNEALNNSGLEPGMAAFQVVVEQILEQLRANGIYGDETEMEDVDSIEYQVVENTPSIITPDSSLIFTERYDGGYDQNVLYDSCSISESFNTDLSIKVLNTNLGTTGDCYLYSDRSKIEGTETYAVKTEIFECPGDTSAPFVPLVNFSDTAVRTLGYYNHRSAAGMRGVETVGNLIVVPTPMVSFVDGREGSGPGASVTVPIGDAESCGYTIYREVAIKESIRNNLVQTIENAIVSSDTITDPFNTKFKPSEYNAIVQVYERPDDGTKNKMKVYKLTPIVNLRPKFPSNHYERV